jgi:chemotaxis protein MotB
MSRVRSERRLALCAALAALTWSASACVSSGAHDTVVQERDSLSRESGRLSGEVDRLKTANGSLSAERVDLIDQNEDLRSERDALRGEASRLTNENQQLNTNLEQTTTEVDAKRAEVGRLRDTYQGLVSDLESEVAAGQIEIEQLREGVRVNVSDDILFGSGSATLDSVGQAVLDKVAQRMAQGDFRIEVQGHTDNIAIRGALTKRYPTNWELAGARASRVVRLFQEAGVDGGRLQAISFAEFAPVGSNDTAEERWLNRRIEIRLHSVEAPIADESVAAPSEREAKPSAEDAPPEEL